MFFPNKTNINNINNLILNSVKNIKTSKISHVEKCILTEFTRAAWFLICLPWQLRCGHKGWTLNKHTTNNRWIC